MLDERKPLELEPRAACAHRARGELVRAGAALAREALEGSHAHPDWGHERDNRPCRGKDAHSLRVSRAALTVHAKPSLENCLSMGEAHVARARAAASHEERAC